MVAYWLHSKSRFTMAGYRAERHGWSHEIHCWRLVFTASRILGYDSILLCNHSHYWHTGKTTVLVYCWVAAVKVSALNSFGLNSRGLGLAGDPSSTTQSTVPKPLLSQLLHESLSGIVDLMTFPQVIITFRSREHHPRIYWWGSDVRWHAQGHTANEHDSHGSSTWYYKHSLRPTEVDTVNAAKTQSYMGAERTQF